MREPRPERFAHSDDELLGLDPDDPEAQAFAAHLDRMQRQRPAFTVEGYIDGVREFAESANRAQGGRRWAAKASPAPAARRPPTWWATRCCSCACTA